MSRDYAGVRRVAVIGAGTIGSSWAAYFLSRGLEVIASDPKPESESFLRRYITAAWPSLERLGLAAGASVERLRFVRDPMTAIEGADFVQENIPEREKLKIDLFEQLGSALPMKVLIASSSSGLPISRLQSRCRFPERCVLGHPFNPPHIIPLVEVLTPKLQRSIIQGVAEETGERPISQLAKERDASLIAIYEALGRNSGRPDETSIKG